MTIYNAGSYVSDYLHAEGRVVESAIRANLRLELGSWGLEEVQFTEVSLLSVLPVFETGEKGEHFFHLDFFLVTRTPTQIPTLPPTRAPSFASSGTEQKIPACFQNAPR